MATNEIYTLSLHDALPISQNKDGGACMEFNILQHFRGLDDMPKDPFNGDEIGTSLFLTGNMGPRISDKMDSYAEKARSEEHTSELQSQFHLVCRLLLEKKK